MATITELLAAGKVRFELGHEFGPGLDPGYCYAVDTEDGLPTILAAAVAPGYVGAVAVRFGEEVPVGVPQDDPAHCWAALLKVGGRPVGAVVTWTTAEAEGAYRAAKRAAEEVPFDDFQARRHGTPVVDG